MSLKNIITTALCAILFANLFGITAVSAAGISMDIPDVGCLVGDQSQCPAVVEKGNISQSIIRIYQFAVGIAGVLAVGMIVAGSLYWSASAGSPDKQREGKDMITSALWGLILLFGSYVILNTINPRLVALEQPDVPELEPCEYDVEGELLSTGPCVPAPYRYQPIPGEEIATRINDEVYEAAAAARPERVAYCENLQGISEARMQDCVVNGGYCNGCTNLSSELQSHMKPDQCRWDSEPVTVSNNCLVQPETNAALASLSDKLDSLGIDFQITEVYPPTTEHISKTHYNGCSVDITVNPTRCASVEAAIVKAQESGFNVFNEYESCDGVESKTSTGKHLHLTAANCQ